MAKRATVSHEVGQDRLTTTVGDLETIVPHLNPSDRRHFCDAIYSSRLNAGTRRHDMHRRTSKQQMPAARFPWRRKLLGSVAGCIKLWVSKFSAAFSCSLSEDPSNYTLSNSCVFRLSWLAASRKFSSRSWRRAGRWGHACNFPTNFPLLHVP